ncbi:hypothetical protein SAMN05428995_102183 [Loktanella sp. DSM 29012]|uniref:hypothetical protein n=1 Tax=Loktanella sp. DSM 29012 TaxID=1881056 RepID=UPI0008B59C88|nr:hypothetical protein [Loktanella sp. DSM 29012]SEP97259.1 hypothetical protein SAMN05428995_102183 [Loktanella sp. DSM 29012]
MRQAFLLMICVLGFGPGMAQAQAANQACDINDEVFRIEPDGIFPPEIYFEELTTAWDSTQVDICFFNHSEQNLRLRYQNDAGEKVYTPLINQGAQSPILLDKGPSEIRAVNLITRTYTDRYACGTQRVRYCVLFYCWYETRTVYCEEQRTEIEEQIVTEIDPGTLIEGLPTLTY